MVWGRFETTSGLLWVSSVQGVAHILNYYMGATVKGTWRSYEECTYVLYMQNLLMGVMHICYVRALLLKVIGVA